MDDELKRNLGSQKAENVKLQSQIGQLKAEKTQLQQNLIGLQRRIGELELSIGAEAEGNSLWFWGTNQSQITSIASVPLHTYLMLRAT